MLEHEESEGETMELGKNEEDVLGIYRQACFNVVFHNRDDQLRWWNFLILGLCMKVFQFLNSMILVLTVLFNVIGYAGDKPKRFFLGVKIENFGESLDSGSVWREDALEKISEIRRNNPCVKDIIDAALDAFESSDVKIAVEESLAHPLIRSVVLYVNFLDPNPSSLCKFKGVSGEVIVNSSSTKLVHIIDGEYPNFSVDKLSLISQIKRLTKDRILVEQETNRKFKIWEEKRSSLAITDPFFDRIPGLSIAP